MADLACCFNKECPNFSVKIIESTEKYPEGCLEPGGHGNCCLVYKDIHDCQDYVEILIECKKCGLPIELCECPDAKVRYDWETDRFVIRQPKGESGDSQNNNQQAAGQNDDTSPGAA